MKKILFILIMMACSVSWAEWEITGTSDDNDFFLHDISTKRKNGSIAKMWTMIEHSQVQFDNLGQMYKSQIGLWVFDCGKATRAQISIRVYSGSMGGGSVVFNHTRKDREWEWDPITPGTIGEGQWKIACSKR